MGPWLGAIKICCIKKGESIVFIGICLYCQKDRLKDKPKTNKKDCMESKETGYREAKSSKLDFLNVKFLMFRILILDHVCLILEPYSNRCFKTLVSEKRISSENIKQKQIKLVT